MPDDAISSDDVSEPFTGFADMGSAIDAEFQEAQTEPEPEPATKKRRTRGRSQPKDQTENEKPKSREPRSGPPTLDEWSRFFSRVVLRVVCEWYIQAAFRGIDEDALSEREIERLAMTDDERQLIATPFAELSNRSKFMRRHGRMIVASGDSFNALVVLGAWMTRVNRIASKYRPKEPRIREMKLNGSAGQGTSQANGSAQGSTGGRFPNGFAGPIFPGSG